MKIFISWSGERSRIIAEGLNSWLPKVIQAVKTFYSPEIEKGTRGIEEINKTLEGTSFGIICLTPDNLNSTWIHYEAGALSKIEDARIWTLLHNLKHSDIVQPLAQFQHTLTKKEDIYKLLNSINEKLSEPLDKSVLRDSFERWWSDFEEVLQRAENISSEEKKEDKNIRSDRDILEEMLEILRNMGRNSPSDLLRSLQRKKVNKGKPVSEADFLFSGQEAESDLEKALTIISENTDGVFDYKKTLADKGVWRLSITFKRPASNTVFSEVVNTLLDSPIGDFIFTTSRPNIEF